MACFGGNPPAILFIFILQIQIVMYKSMIIKSKKEFESESTVQYKSEEKKSKQLYTKSIQN